MVTRLMILAVLASIVATTVLVYRRRLVADEALGSADSHGAAWPTLPEDLTTGSDRTWLIFTTPMCASCPQVQADLERSFPNHNVVKIDATENLDLADSYGVRRAPTTLLADASGAVLNRLVGPEAIRNYIASAGTQTSLP